MLKVPLVQMQLGRVLTTVNLAKASVLASYTAASRCPGSDGAVQPNRAVAFAQRAWAPNAYVQADRKRSSGSPAARKTDARPGGAACDRDLGTPRCGPLIERYVRSPGHTAEERIKLYKLVWDAVCAEFASRHEHYERSTTAPLYAGRPAAFREGRLDVCEALADTALAGYALSDLLGDAGEDAALSLTSSPAR